MFSRAFPRGIARLCCFCAFLAMVVGAAAGGCRRGGSVPPPPDRVELPQPGGAAIPASVYRPLPSAQGIAPAALLLVPEPGADPAVWAPLAGRAQAAGYLVLAPSLTYPPEPMRAIPALAAAAGWLIAQGADPGNLAAAGAGLGGHLAAHFALQDPRIQAVILVSPGLTERGLSAEEAVSRLRELPLLLLCADGDSYSAASASRLKELAPGFAELRTFPGAAHGADLFAASANAIEITLGWLDTALGPRPTR